MIEKSLTDDVAQEAKTLCMKSICILGNVSVMYVTPEQWFSDVFQQ